MHWVGGEGGGYLKGRELLFFYTGVRKFEGQETNVFRRVFARATAVPTVKLKIGLLRWNVQDEQQVFYQIDLRFCGWDTSVSSTEWPT